MAKTETKAVEDMTAQELQIEQIRLLKLQDKRLKSIDGSTSFLFWLGLVGLIGGIISIFI